MNQGLLLSLAHHVMVLDRLGELNKVYLDKLFRLEIVLLVKEKVNQLLHHVPNVEVKEKNAINVN